jgi:hypothetical protein
VNLIRNLHRYFSDLLQWNKSYISRKKDLYLLKKNMGPAFRFLRQVNCLPRNMFLFCLPDAVGRGL